MESYLDKTGLSSSISKSQGQQQQQQKEKDDDNNNQTEFVDYVPAPEVTVLPPAKYKLWMIIFILVYFASWVADEAGMREFLEFHGWLSFNASLFLQLAIVVFVLVYAAMDLFMTCLTFQNPRSGKIYGVVAWMKAPRAQWMYRHENLFFEISARIVHILEDGFAMFDAPPSSSSSSRAGGEQPPPKQFHCKDGSCSTTLKIEHRIKPDRLDDYNKWLLRIQKTVKNLDGVECVHREVIKKEEEHEEVKEEGDGTTTQSRDDSGGGGGDEEEGIAIASTTTTTITKDNDNHHHHHHDNNKPFLAVIYVKFNNIDYLNDWMLSPRRRALMNQLEPMLSTPDIVQIEKERELPDAFSDVLSRQGISVPKSPPRKWKVWWLTLLALDITIHWSISFLPYYLDLWGRSDIDSRLKRLVDIFIVTFLNVYVMAPLFLFLFDHWLQNDNNINNKKQPWKMLDKGLESFWLKVALTLAYYGGCVVAILVKKKANF